MQFAKRKHEKIILSICFLLMNIIQIEVVSSEEYEAVEASLEIAASLLKARDVNCTGAERIHNHCISQTIDLTLDSASNLSGSAVAKFQPGSDAAFDQNNFDIEDFPSHTSLDPSPLEIWGRSAVFVTTLCMQEWCEKQLDFSLRFLSISAVRRGMHDSADKLRL